MKKTLASNYRLHFYGALYVDFLTCEKLLLPDVNMRVKLYRSSNELSLIGLGDNAKKSFIAVVEEASIFVRKVTLTESVNLSIEPALLKAPARYPYIEVFVKAT